MTNMGVSQGGGLSSSLFYIYMDKIIRKTEKKTKTSFCRCCDVISGE